jgi:hypothetical protein
MLYKEFFNAYLIIFKNGRKSERRKRKIIRTKIRLKIKQSWTLIPSGKSGQIPEEGKIH